MTTKTATSTKMVFLKKGDNKTVTVTLIVTVSNDNFE